MVKKEWVVLRHSVIGEFETEEAADKFAIYCFNNNVINREDKFEVQQWTDEVEDGD